MRLMYDWCESNSIAIWGINSALGAYVAALLRKWSLSDENGTFGAKMANA